MNSLNTHTESEIIAALMYDTIYYVDNWSSSVAIAKEKEVVPPVSFSYLGGNKKNILILLNSPKGGLSKADLEFLTKIISALNLTLDDIALINYARYQDYSLEQVKRFFNCEKVISFSIPDNANIVQNTKILSITNINGVDFLNMPDSLAEISADKAKKLQLWNYLKSLFNVK